MFAVQGVARGCCAIREGDEDEDEDEAAKQNTCNDPLLRRVD